MARANPCYPANQTLLEWVIRSVDGHVRDRDMATMLDLLMRVPLDLHCVGKTSERWRFGRCLTKVRVAASLRWNASAAWSLKQLDAIRVTDRIASFFPSNARVLEIGAGTSKQALELQRRNFHVTAIEIQTSTYRTGRVYPILDYDGATIPLPDGTVDVVFSSNVLEHVPNLVLMHSEIRRILKTGGKCIHVLPTHGWRFWTTLAGYPDAVLYFVSSVPQLLRRELPRSAELRCRLGGARCWTARRVAGRCLPHRHGERGNFISEMWLFHPHWWRRNFRNNGFTVVHDDPMGLFYTGNMLLGAYLGFSQRRRLSAVLGSACHLFELIPKPS
jgi:SAM-dependent methyltransferase